MAAWQAARRRRPRTGARRRTERAIDRFMKLGAGRDESEFKLAPPPQRRPLSNPHAELAEGDGRRRGRCRVGDKGQTVKEKIGRTAPSDFVGPHVSVL